MRRTLCAVSGLGLCLALILSLPSRAVRAQTGGTATPAVRVGMPATFFHDLPPVLVRFATEPFRTVLRDTTGMPGELVVAGDPFATANALCADKVQLGVFHSFEFGWVQQEHPELKPLMVAVNSQRSVTAYVLVPRDSSVKGFGELKDKQLTLPRRTREHCRVYVEHLCKAAGASGSKAFFNQVVSSSNVEAGLDDLCRGKVDAALVDSIGLEFYKDLKPGCFTRMRILAETEFPPAVIAYRTGGLDAATIDRLRDGMCSAHKTDLGREMMSLWKITSFNPVPADYAAAVAACIKSYPSPKQ